MEQRIDFFIGTGIGLGGGVFMTMYPEHHYVGIFLLAISAAFILRGLWLMIAPQRKADPVFDMTWRQALDHITHNSAFGTSFIMDGCDDEAFGALKRAVQRKRVRVGRVTTSGIEEVPPDLGKLELIADYPHDILDRKVVNLFLTDHKRVGIRDLYFDTNEIKGAFPERLKP